MEKKIELTKQQEEELIKKIEKNKENLLSVQNSFKHYLISIFSKTINEFTETRFWKTLEFFNYKCPYTGTDLTEAIKTGTFEFDILFSYRGFNFFSFGNVIITTQEVKKEKKNKAYIAYLHEKYKGNSFLVAGIIQSIREFQDLYFWSQIGKSEDLNKVLEYIENETNRFGKWFTEYSHYIEELNNTNETYLPFVPFKPKFSFTKEKDSGLERIIEERKYKLLIEDAIKELRDNGVEMNEKTIYFRLEPQVNKYINFGNKSAINSFSFSKVSFILDDTKRQILHILNIPEDIFSEKDFQLGIQFKYNDDSYIELISRKKLEEYFVGRLKYTLL
ncbi:MAG: hypothetical protein MJ185_02750 [Treponema sp.]|nr:hypothetical protein [Treponema sp.]